MLENLINLVFVGLVLCGIGAEIERDKERKRKEERIQVLRQRLLDLHNFEDEIKRDLEELRILYEHDS